MLRWFERGGWRGSQLRRRKNPDEGIIIRKAYCKDDAGAAATITCYLDVDATGTEITVNCSIAGGGTLNAALPLLTDGLEISVWNDNGTWKCFWGFRKADICPLDE